MKARAPIAAAVVAVALAVWALAPSPQPPGTLARLFPAGPLLYLEAGDFGALVRDWNTSQEKRLWLAGDNYQVFSRSHLFFRLKQAQDEFTAAAGLAPDMSLVEALAGGESALAIYDIGELEFLYLTRLGSARAVESALWRSRANYQPRSAAGQPYFVRVDPASRRLAAFAASGDFLLLATREDLIAGALSIMANHPLNALAAEPWFDAAWKAAGPPGELRMVMNVAALAGKPHFRSHWIQRDVASLRQYRSGVADLQRRSGEFREERVLVRAQPAEPKESRGLARVLKLVPPDAGLYRGWAAPAPEAVLDAIERKILAPRTAPAAPSKRAPLPTLAITAGSEDDLETRIDQAPPAAVESRFAAEELRGLLARARPEAMVEIQRAVSSQADVYVRTEALVAVLAAADWDAPAVRQALRAAAGGLYTTGMLGFNWVDRGGRHALDGLMPLAVAVHGPVLLLSNSSDLLAGALARLDAPASPSSGVYVAAYRHAGELENFIRMMRLIDYPAIAATPAEARDARQPRFFSENVGSLGRALGRLDSATIVVRDTGASLNQSVVYRWSR